MKVTRTVYCIALVLSQGEMKHQTRKIQAQYENFQSAHQFFSPEDSIVLDDVFISVKTTYRNHDTRLLLILRTWFQLAMNQTWFFTDEEDESVQSYTHGHLINTRCHDTHERDHLCCKTNIEFDTYLASGEKWFCHFDDDVFVNVPRLLEVLQSYDHHTDWYLGKSCNTKTIKVKQSKSRSFWATFTNALGGGYCISKKLAKKMAPHISDGKLVRLCKLIDRPDDQTIGYIIEHILKKRLTEVAEFHTHLEALPNIDPKTFPEQITFSYGMPDNVVTVPGVDARGDGTRFLSLFEYLYTLKVKDPNILLTAGGDPSFTLSSSRVTSKKISRNRKMLHKP